MYLTNLQINNLKLLREFSWSFERDGKPRMWTVFLGENGLCKTSLLRSIAMAATGYVRANQLADELISSFPDGRYDKPPPVDIRANFSFSERYHAQRTYPGLEPKPTSPPVLTSHLHLEPGKRLFEGQSEYLNLPQRAENPVAEARMGDLRHWFVAGYGVNRLLHKPGASELHADPLMGRLNPLFDKGGLFGTQFTDELEYSRQYVDTLREILSGVDDTGQTTGLLPNVSNIELRGRGGVRSSADLIERHRIVFKFNLQEMKVPAVSMSHGYQATMAWIADLVGQIFLEAKEPVPANEMEGIVLIDELDLHLHPTWQVKIVEDLKRVFRRVQFIATTHSPMVLPGLKQDEIVLLKQDEQGSVFPETAPETPALMTGSDIYRTFFGIDRLYPVELGEALRRYGFLVGNPLRTDDEEAEMLALRKHLADHGVDPGWEPVARQARFRVVAGGGS